MAEMLKVAKAMFQNRKSWEEISDEEKSECFFIFNRFFCKKFPEYAQLLNKKNIDKVLGMEIWFQFMKDKAYPKWFWTKSESGKKIYNGDIKDSEINQLLINLGIHRQELNLLIKYYPDLISEEIKYYKSLKK